MINYQETAHAVLRAARVNLAQIVPIEQAFSAPTLRRVWVPRPVDDASLAVLAHEAGHVATSLALHNDGYGRLTIEYMASKWAEAELVRQGVEITAAMQTAWRAGIASYLYGAELDELYEAEADGTLDAIAEYVKGN